MEPKDQIRTSFSCESDAAIVVEPASLAHVPPLPEPGVEAGLEEEQVRVTREDREIARIALTERMKRKFPKRAPPRWYDRADVEMVAACTAATEGDREAKLKANRDAITGAFCASKDGPPTSRFIWGRLEHFLEHVDRGRRKAWSEDHVARSRADDREGAHEASRLSPSDPVAVPRDQVVADLARIFGVASVRVASVDDVYAKQAGTQ